MKCVPRSMDAIPDPRVRCREIEEIARTLGLPSAAAATQAAAPTAVTLPSPPPMPAGMFQAVLHIRGGVGEEEEEEEPLPPPPLPPPPLESELAT